MPKIAIYQDPIFLEHDTGEYHPERSDRLRAIHKVLDEVELKPYLKFLSPRSASVDDFSLIHDSEYVSKIESYAGQEISLDGDTVMSSRSYKASQKATGAVLDAIDEAYLGLFKRSFAAVRPPGHHAERSRAMGFCLFNNIAIGAEYARHRHRTERVAIVDFDVHHGNGTQWAFYDRNDVFYVSTHQYPFYPGTGSVREEGQGKGKGFTLNVPFSGGQGDHEYLRAFEDRILPTLEDYRPDLILVSAGFDAHRLDPLGGMEVTGKGFGLMMKYLVDLAEKTAQGRIVSVLEGGYSLEGLEDSVRECLKTLIFEERTP